MSEKVMATIDRGLIIPDDSEKIFENQYIRLEAGIECKGTLIFRNCTIEPCATLESKNGRKLACKPGCISMGIDGKLEMDGCEVIHPGQDFLSSWNMVIKNTSFLINSCPDTGISIQFSIQSVLAPCVIAAHGKAKFEGCSFMEETGNSASTSKLDLIRFDVANINNCIVVDPDEVVRSRGQFSFKGREAFPDFEGDRVSEIHCDDMLYCLQVTYIGYTGTDALCAKREDNLCPIHMCN